MLKPIDYNKHFVIGTPLVGWKCDKGEDLEWLGNRLNIIEHPWIGYCSNEILNYFSIDNARISNFYLTFPKVKIIHFRNLTTN